RVASTSHYQLRVLSMLLPPPHTSLLFPYTTLFRSVTICLICVTIHGLETNLAMGGCIKSLFLSRDLYFPTTCIAGQIVKDFEESEFEIRKPPRNVRSL